MARGPITDRLARHAASLTPADLPPEVMHEGRRAFLNALGCVLGGARHHTTETADAALAPFAGPAECSLLGRGRKADALHATLVNGIASSAYSYDDTHAQALVHPSGPVLAALLALAERTPVRGSDLLAAFVLGVEINCRLSMAISVPPARGSVGWSQSGVACGVGTALAAGRLLGLDAGGLRSAIGIAASQAAGVRSLHGTMCTALMPAHAGQTGLRAALLAAGGFTGGDASLEGRHGFLDLFCDEPDVEALVGSLGTRFEILRNTYKPYPCGIVIHPIVDACLRLRELGVAAADVERIRVRASPGGMALCNRRHPADELEAQVSLHHWVAAVMLHGATGIDALAPERVADRAMRAFQERVEADEDPSLATDATELAARLGDGRTLTVRIEHATGSLDNPMTDAQLAAKFTAQGEARIGEARCRALIEMCKGLDRLPDVRAVADTAR